MLHAQAGFCCFKEADRTLREAQELIDRIGIERIPKSQLASWYIKVSVLNFAKSDYDLSYVWSIKALKQLSPKTPDRYACCPFVLMPVSSMSNGCGFFFHLNRITIDVLRQAAKSCVLKRHFKKAHILLIQAVKMAKYMNKYNCDWD